MIPPDLGPESAFVRSMPGLKLIIGQCPDPACRGAHHLFLFVCGPERDGLPHGHFVVEPGFDSARPPRHGGSDA